MLGMDHNQRSNAVGSQPSYLPSGDTGRDGGGTYSGQATEPTVQDYENFFGPSARDIKTDLQRYKRHGRWHLPGILQGPNPWLTDRIDGLITDATNSPFTTKILPYRYKEDVDGKIKWNVWSFDEGMASRVPYESAARVLTQTKSSHAGYAVRHGLAIKMEHNFLASAAGLQNFQRQLTQLVGSIQLTNNLDVHIALLQAPSYQKTVDEKYYDHTRTLHRAGKTFCDLFGIMQKIPNALDIIIEDARNHLSTWGSPPPTFLMCPSSLTAQLTMLPEQTEYLTNGPAGPARLAKGPDLPSYRGLSIIHSQKFELERGRVPRNVLKRRVRVAEYYWVEESHPHTIVGVYNQKMDSMENFTKQALIQSSGVLALFNDDIEDNPNVLKALNHAPMMLLRPNVEHEMLGVIVGRGGTQELGATFWGQTELACYDDAQHGLWGMSYKYHERAMVTNERNMIRMFDIAFDGYIGGMDTDVMKWSDNETNDFLKATYDQDTPFAGSSVVVMLFPRFKPPKAEFVTKPGSLYKKVFVDNLNHEFDAAARVWYDIDLMNDLPMQATEKVLQRLTYLMSQYEVDLAKVNAVLHRAPLVPADMENAELKDFLDDLINMLQSKTQPFVVPNPIVLSTAMTNGQKTVWLDPEKSQNITDATKHSFIQTFTNKYDNVFTRRAFDKYDTALGHAWGEENMTSAATHIQNNTVDIPTLAYHGNMVVKNVHQHTPARDVKCVGHLGNSYPGVASIREGRGRLYQPDSVTKMHIM